MITNDVKKYPTPKMQAIKKQHENAFSNPERAILDNLQDWTNTEKVNLVSNLTKINEVCGWKHNSTELEIVIEKFNKYMDRLSRVL